VSAPKAFSAAGVKTMAPDAVVFALANPSPEIRPEQAPDNVAIMATGRTDYPNQINNVLAFPGVFKGALSVRASRIDQSMQLAAAGAIADLITPAELHPEYIVPSVFNRRVADSVAEAVADAATASGLAGHPR
jgi:malate dehydrogenase (oxaloacetate-decarboxylating)